MNTRMSAPSSCLAMVLTALLFPALVSGGGSGAPSLFAYAGSAAASTASSFGGGEAYVPVAEGFRRTVAHYLATSQEVVPDLLRGQHHLAP